MNHMNLKKVLYILYRIIAAGFVLILLGAALKSVPVTVLGVLVIIAAAVFNTIKWRCPHCGRHLGRSIGKFCPNCGKKLDDLE